jgi:hypothetical protein
MNNYFANDALLLVEFFTFSTKVFAGLKLGTKCSGIIIAVFFEMLRAVFLALFLTINEHTN